MIGLLLKTGQGNPEKCLVKIILIFTAVYEESHLG